VYVVVASCGSGQEKVAASRIITCRKVSLGFNWISTLANTTTISLPKFDSSSAAAQPWDIGTVAWRLGINFAHCAQFLLIHISSKSDKIEAAETLKPPDRRQIWEPQPAPLLPSSSIPPSYTTTLTSSFLHHHPHFFLSTPPELPP